MSWRSWTRNAESTPGISAWKPVRRVRFDVETFSPMENFESQHDERLWIEAIKDGSIVGVVDAHLVNGALPQSVLDRLAELRQVELSPLQTLPDEQLPFASVVVPTICEDPTELVRTVESLLAQDYPEYEVLVVDNRSDPNHGPLPAFPIDQRLRILAEPMSGTSAARNLGIAQSTGGFIAFTDDDASVDSQWLRVLGSRFTADGEIDAIGGLVLPMEFDTAPQMWFEEFYGGFSPSFSFEKLSIERQRGIDAMFPYAIGRFGAGCNMAFRRSALTRIGNYNVYLGGGTIARAGEDLELALRLVVTGGTYAYEPLAVVWHTHRRTEEEFLRQVFNYGMGLTALYTALIVDDPRHLLRIARRLPAGLRHLARPRELRSESTEPSYPSRTLAYQVLGMSYGPIAYARSVVSTKRRARSSHGA